MANELRYTTLAHRYTARFPVVTYVGTQVNFWIVANVILTIILYFQSEIISQSYHVPVVVSFGPMMLLSIVLGVLYGVPLGLTGYYLDRDMLKQESLGKIILLKTASALFVLIIIMLLLRYVFLGSLFQTWSVNIPGSQLSEQSWRALFHLLIIYYSVMTLVISFINLVNKKYGPGILIPLILGRYRSPKEEQRIFMFMDLKSSTTTAEVLGHLRYSAFIRDCFADINELLYPYRAQVYQYVGDEIVVTWPENEGLKNNYCIAFYFACKERFKSRTDYYIEKYNLVPSFKAGIHTGIVSAVEIGEYKRDIAYHGDTLNTAARIQGICNDFEKDLIASKEILHKMQRSDTIQTTSLGRVSLKGKSSPIELFSIDGF